MKPDIRRAAAADWPAIAALCADTGRQGDPVDDDERAGFRAEASVEAVPGVVLSALARAA